MRRIDWFLAGVVAMFLIGAAAIEATGSVIANVEVWRDRPMAVSDISMRRLIGHLPDPLLPSGPR